MYLPFFTKNIYLIFHTQLFVVETSSSFINQFGQGNLYRFAFYKVHFYLQSLWATFSLFLGCLHFKDVIRVVAFRDRENCKFSNIYINNVIYLTYNQRLRVIYLTVLLMSLNILNRSNYLIFLFIKRGNKSLRCFRHLSE